MHINDVEEVRMYRYINSIGLSRHARGEYIPKWINFQTMAERVVGVYNTVVGLYTSESLHGRNPPWMLESIEGPCIASVLCSSGNDMRWNVRYQVIQQRLFHQTDHDHFSMRVQPRGLWPVRPIVQTNTLGQSLSSPHTTILYEDILCSAHNHAYSRQWTLLSVPSCVIEVTVIRRIHHPIM